jgi:hypothetical protein
MNFRFNIRDIFWLIIVVALAFGWWLYAARTNETIQRLQQPAVDRGMPFGEITGKDIDSLYAFAAQNGENLEADCDKMYEKDIEAMKRVFRLSTHFDNLDKNCRSYGQLIYSSFLNLGESWGVEKYANVLSSEPPEVQQRVRDFICYPASLLPPQEMKRSIDETKQAYPTMFPAGYEFGKGNQLFR